MSTLNTLMALNTKLKTITGFANAINLPNTKFNPASSVTKYLQAMFLPNESDVVALGSTEIKNQGIYQVLCKRRLNKGTAVLSDVDLVKALFLPGTDLTKTGTVVRIIKTWDSPAYIDGDWYVVPVSVSWFSYS